MQKSRRDLLVKSGIAVGGSIGLATLYQNCGDPNMTLAKNPSSSVGASSLASLGYTAGVGVSVIDGVPVQEAATGSDLDIFVDFTVATHYSHTDFLGTHEQFLLAVTAGRSRALPYQQRWRSNRSSETVLAILLYDKDTGNLIRCRRLNESSSTVATMFMIPDSFLSLTRNVSVVVHHSSRGFLKRDFTMSKNLAASYSTLVAPYNPALPFAGADLQRPFVAGAGVASGGQGDLGLIHYPQIEILAEDTVRVTLGGSTSRHPRIGEDHYIAGGAIYDQDGHELATTATVPYNDIVNFSTVTFPRAAIRDRGVTQIRATIHDTANGYLMGFLNVG